MHNIVEKNFNISIAPERSPGKSLVSHKMQQQINNIHICEVCSEIVTPKSFWSLTIIDTPSQIKRKQNLSTRLITYSYYKTWSKDSLV
jgi:hypothetical protein